MLFFSLKKHSVFVKTDPRRSCWKNAAHEELMEGKAASASPFRNPGYIEGFKEAFTC